MKRVYSNLVCFELFNFSFFIYYMLAYNWIIFFDFHFFRHVAFVLRGCVIVACASCRNEFDFVSHGLFSLYLFTTTANFFQNGLNTFFINDTQTFAADA